MKTKLFKTGSLLFYSYMTNREMSNNALWLFTEDFVTLANRCMEQFNIKDHYSGVDLRLYVGNRKPSKFETRILKVVKKFEVKCLCLGLIDYIKTAQPDIAKANETITLLNNPDKIINADTRAMILNEFCVSVPD